MPSSAVGRRGDESRFAPFSPVRLSTEPGARCGKPEFENPENVSFLKVLSRILPIALEPVFLPAGFTIVLVSFPRWICRV
tara:strand:- start:29105 stop:29344 length:240 start_codon:yes stop_codon:yes gene_type:complete